MWNLVRCFATYNLRNAESILRYDDYIKRQADIKEREKQLREQRTEPAPEGHSKCPKCGCKMDMTMLQTRSADEPMTIFKNCVNCGYIIRK